MNIGKPNTTPFTKKITPLANIFGGTYSNQNIHEPENMFDKNQINKIHKIPPIIYNFEASFPTFVD